MIQPRRFPSLALVALSLLAGGASSAGAQDLMRFECLEGQTIVASVDRATGAVNRDIAPPREREALRLSIAADLSDGPGSLVTARVEQQVGQSWQSFPNASMEVGSNVAADDGHWYFDLAAGTLFIAEPFLGQGARFRRFSCLPG